MPYIKKTDEQYHPGYKKLSDEDIVNIIKLHNEGRTNTEIANIFNCHHSNISKIISKNRRRNISNSLELIIEKVNKNKPNDSLENVIEKIRKRTTYELNGEHLVWNYFHPDHTTPQIFFRGKATKVANLVYEFYKNVKLKKNQTARPNCGNILCVNISHLTLAEIKTIKKKTG